MMGQEVGKEVQNEEERRGRDPETVEKGTEKLLMLKLR